MLTKNFNVSLTIYTDDLGIEYILPEVAELDKMESMINEAEIEAHALLENKLNSSSIGEGQLAACERSRKDLERRRKIREAYKTHENTSKVNYSLKVPTYGMYLSAEDEARSTSADGIPSIDESKLMKCLLVECMGKDNPLELSPSIAKVLYAELKRRSFPDASMLPFPCDAG